MTRSYRLFSMTAVIIGILAVAISLIYSLITYDKLDIYKTELYGPVACGLFLMVIGVILHFAANKAEQRERDEQERSPFNLETIIISYAMVNEHPKKNLKDLHFYLLSEGIAEISLKELKLMVDKAILNVKMDLIKPSLKAKLFTDKGEMRKYQFASDFCPKCGVFKNYHKECKFCGYHEMSK